ncbi:hypothetical protein [Micromonospora sp. NPDC005324]|uniref:hypothetical protein n=1 Tax=Micromonospora sp. NPDC005324 TaxID=3157033 RepID=UPI0033AD03A1
MSGPQIPPHVTAAVDQCRAELSELVGAVREHRDANACELPGYCPGFVVAEFVQRAGSDRRRALLYAALAELAALDYGLPVHLTEAAVVALNDKPKSRGWWPWRRR